MRFHNKTDALRVVRTICLWWTIISLTMPFFAPPQPPVVEYVYRTELLHHTQYIEVEVEPTPYYHVTSVERELLARLLWTEARGEPIECQRAVISVVFNRLYDDSFPDTIEDVVKQDRQFDLANSLWKITPTETQYEAVDYVLYNGSTLPYWVQYFRSKHHFSWNGYSPYAQIGKTYFGGYENA